MSCMAPSPVARATQQNRHVPLAYWIPLIPQLLADTCKVVDKVYDCMPPQGLQAWPSAFQTLGKHLVKGGLLVEEEVQHQFAPLSWLLHYIVECLKLVQNKLLPSHGVPQVIKPRSFCETTRRGSVCCGWWLE